MSNPFYVLYWLTIPASKRRIDPEVRVYVTTRKRGNNCKGNCIMAKNKSIKKTESAESPEVVQPTGLNLPAGFKMVRQITVPSLSIKKIGDFRVLRFNDEMRVSKVIEKAEAGKKPREPATICGVTDTATGELFTFIVPAVVKSNIERDYAEASYVGKVFYIKNMGKRNETQRYNDFQVLEVAPE